MAVDNGCRFFFFFFQAEDGIRDRTVTGVQTCALPICAQPRAFGDARIVNRNLAQLESLFTTARVPEGAWLRTRFMVYRRGLYSIGGYYHIADRLALRHRYIVLDNYEALYHIFSVGWRTRPDWVAFRQSVEGLTVRLVPGPVRWPTVLYVLRAGAPPLPPAEP